MPQSNELRVFISSTFRDLQEEREHLIQKIFPEIHALCREPGIRFTEVDLRWGLTDEEVALGWVISNDISKPDTQFGEAGHAEQALALYESLYAVTPNHGYRQRTEELQNSSQC